jgi:hypothetical protein
VAAFREPVGSEDQQLSKAVALLEKARSTTFAGENEALVLRAYRLVASYLNTVAPAGSPAARRRERRLLGDRRQTGFIDASSTDSGPPRSPPEGAGRYRDMLERGRRADVHIDLTL